MPSARRRVPLPARLLGRGADAAERVARATGVDTVAEEAIVRAIESQATERALARVLQGPIVEEAVEQAMRSPAVERALNDAIDSEMIDRVWERLLASDEAQKLVERIAEAPEVRSAIAAQGAGLIDDVRREAARATHRLDGGFERVVRRIFFRRRREGTTDRAGAVSRAVALVIDGAILNAAFLAPLRRDHPGRLACLWRRRRASAPAIVIGAGAWAVAGSLYLISFLGARRTDAGDALRAASSSTRRSGARIGLRTAVRRLVGLVLSIIPFGPGSFRSSSPTQRHGWHDRFAGTGRHLRRHRPRSRAPWSTRRTRGASVRRLSFETLLYATDGPVATITLNRPDSLNTIVPPMPDELEAAVRGGGRRPRGEGDRAARRRAVVLRRL